MAENRCWFVAKVCALVVYMIIGMSLGGFGGYYLAQDTLITSKKLNSNNSNQTQMTIAYTITVNNVENLDRPFINCTELQGVKSERQHTLECTPFGKALVSLIYQEICLIKLINGERGWDTMTSKGHIKINSSSIIFTMTERNLTIVTSKKISPTPSYSTFKVISTGENSCSYWNGDEKQDSCLQTTKNEIRLRSVVMGIQSSNETGTVVVPSKSVLDNKPVNTYNGVTTAQFKAGLHPLRFELNVLEYESSRKLMCQCIADNAVLQERLAATPEQIRQQCFDEKKIRKEFQPLLQTPGCFGAKEF